MSANKAKGSRYEREVVTFLSDEGFPEVGRIYAHGASNDVGDVAGLPGFVVQCKNRASIDLASFVDEANHQRDNAEQPFGCAVIKRRNRSVGDSYVAMDLATFAKLLRAADLGSRLADFLEAGGT